MSRTVDRKNAIMTIVKYRVDCMSDDEKISLIKDEGLEIHADKMIEYGSEMVYLDDFIIDLLDYQYYGMKNEYIINIFADFFNEYIEISGEPEYMYMCDCCNFYSIKEKNNYEICKVCFWEDDGSNKDGYSSANRMNLSKARQKYREIGCIDEKYLNYIEKNPLEKYRCANDNYSLVHER